MMADLGVHKTLVELRAMLSTIDFTLGAQICFMELLCASFGKDYLAILDHTDHGAVIGAQKAAAAAQALEDEIMAKHEADERAARELAEQLEKESKLVCSAQTTHYFLYNSN